MRHRLIILFALLFVVGAGLWSVALTRRAAKADSISTMLSGSAYGLSVTAANGATAISGGPFGAVSTVCSPYPVNQENTLLRLNLLRGLIASTTLRDKLTFARTDDTSAVVATSTIERLTIGQSLLGPLIEVGGLRAFASSSARAAAATSTTAASSFGRIRIAGLRLPLRIRPNTRISLPGLGRIVLNEQITRNLNPATTYAEVNMLDITLSVGNILRLAAGTRIIVGHASSIDRIVSVLASMQAHAFGLYTSLGVGNLARVRLGPLPDTKIGCLDGSSSASAVDLRVSSLINGGVVQTRASGAILGSTVTVNSAEKITNLSLLGGLIRAGLLQEQANAVYDGKRGIGFGRFDALGLSIAGVTIQPDVRRTNDRFPLPGLGYVVVNEVVPSSLTAGYALNALDVRITTPNNRLGLAVGLRIIVGHVDAGIAVFS